jgi:hypothetical protein
MKMMMASIKVLSKKQRRLFATKKAPKIFAFQFSKIIPEALNLMKIGSSQIKQKHTIAHPL